MGVVVTDVQLRGYGTRHGYGAALDLSSLATLGQSALDQVIPKIVVDSTMLPSIEMDNPFAPTPVGVAGQSNESNVFMGWLKPRITLYTAAGPYVVAPWGDPGENSYWPLISSALALGVALSIYGAIKLVRGGK